LFSHRLFLRFDTLYPGGEETVVWNELGTGGDGQITYTYYTKKKNGGGVPVLVLRRTVRLAGGRGLQCLGEASVVAL
jgi:hypothetical protein